MTEPNGNGSHQGAAGARVAPSLDALFAELLARTVGPGGRPPALREWLEQAEAWRIVQALRTCRGNRSAAARALGIGRRTLYSKMEKLGIAEQWGAPTLAESGTETAPQTKEARHPQVPRLFVADPAG